MRFPVVLHSDDGVRYGVTVPDLPGCFSSGDTFDAALDSVLEAIDLHLEGLVEERTIRQIPKGDPAFGWRSSVGPVEVGQHQALHQGVALTAVGSRDHIVGGVDLQVIEQHFQPQPPSVENSPTMSGDVTGWLLAQR